MTEPTSFLHTDINDDHDDGGGGRGGGGGDVVFFVDVVVVVVYGSCGSVYGSYGRESDHSRGGTARW